MLQFSSHSACVHSRFQYTMSNGLEDAVLTVHEYDPHRVSYTCRLSQKLSSRFASTIKILKMCAPSLAHF